MDIDIRIISVIISALVSVVILVVKEFIFDKWKRDLEYKRERLRNFYAPLYGLVVGCTYYGSYAYHDYSGHIQLGSSVDVNGKIFFKISQLNEFIFTNAGYASDELIEAWIAYSTKISGPPEEDFYLITTSVKEYNQLKKELKLKYSKEELETGIPDRYHELRTELNQL